MDSDEFVISRRAVAGRLFEDPTFSITHAMNEMDEITGEYCRNQLHPLLGCEAVLWTGGSLGRGEMLPNSDLDIFMITKSDHELTRVPFIEGFDRLETGSLSFSALRALASRALIDFNQFVDGRPLIGSGLGAEVARLIQTTNTYDRQHANAIAEYFFFRHFDFLQKRTIHGPNMKYSSGSARMTLFYNFYNRVTSGRMPATRLGGTPEFLEGVAASERRGLWAPYRALDIILVGKTAAISTYDATGDIRQRYVSRPSLERIFETCRLRLRGMGISDRESYLRAYSAARREVEMAVNAIVEEMVDSHRQAEILRTMALVSTDRVAQVCAEGLEASPADTAALVTFAAWRVVTRADATPAHVGAIAEIAEDLPASQSGGALLAVACSPCASDESLDSLVTHVLNCSAGSYVLKVVARNPNASAFVRGRAARAYTSTEFVHGTR